jgi:hypothetical protein
VVEGPFPEALADVHAELERVHPFLDGNGRTGRLVTNLLLIRLGYPPAIIRKPERTRYLQDLRRADGGDPAPLGEFPARAIIDTLMRFIVPSVAGPARLVPLAALADTKLSARASHGGRSGTPTGSARCTWPVAKHPPLGRRVSCLPVSEEPQLAGGHVLRSTTRAVQLEAVVGTPVGNHAVSPRHHSPGHNPLKAETRRRIPLKPHPLLQPTTARRRHVVMSPIPRQMWL